MARRLMLSIITLATVVSATPNPTPAPSIVVKADYIHAKVRCKSCRLLEKWSKAAVTEGLADSIRTGRLIWASESMATPGGAILADQLGLMGSSLVLMELRNGKMTRFKELKKTWNLVGDSTALNAYVKSETLSFLNTAR